MTDSSLRRDRAAGGAVEALALALALALAFTLALGAMSAAASAQAPSNLRWTPLASDASQQAWMDSTHITVEPGNRVGAWYKVRAPHETTSTVVQYAIDCPGFRLSIRRLITHDRHHAVLSDARPQGGGFFYPPPIRALQDFMHIACRRALSGARK